MAISVAGSAYATGTNVISGAPFTVSAWCRVTTLATNQFIASIGEGGSVNNYHGIRFSSGNKAEAFSRDTGNGIATGTTTITTGVSYHVCGVFASTTSRSIYLNGTSEATNTTTISITSADTTAIASRPNGGLPWNGVIWDVAFWDVALSTPEVAALAKGFSPLLVRGASLIQYYPLLTAADPLRGEKDGYSLTHSGTMADVDNFCIMRPIWANIGIPSATPPASVYHNLTLLGVGY